MKFFEFFFFGAFLGTLFFFSPQSKRLERLDRKKLCWKSWITLWSVILFNFCFFLLSLSSAILFCIGQCLCLHSFSIESRKWFFCSISLYHISSSCSILNSENGEKKYGQCLSMALFWLHATIRNYKLSIRTELIYQIQSERSLVL